MSALRITTIDFKRRKLRNANKKTKTKKKRNET